MKKLIIITLVLVLAGIGTVSAQNMSISEMGFTGPQTIQIYAVNATSGSVALLGTYNTTSNAVPLPSTDFSVVIKPESSDYLKNPNNLITSVFDFIVTNMVGILFCLLLIALWLGRRY